MTGTAPTSAPRPPAAAGTHYPATAARLRADVQGFLDDAEAVTGREVQPRRALGLVVPHAAFAVSGPTAGVGFASVEVPATCIVLAPRHGTPAVAGSAAAVLLERPYSTPLGAVAVDRALGAAIVGEARGLVREDAVPHDGEYSVEVLLPFLQARNPDVRVVPIIVPFDDADSVRRLASAIAAAIGERRADVLVVASSNMTHGEPVKVAADRDAVALDRIVALDGPGLLAVAKRDGISMCALGAVAVACEVSRARGGTDGELVAYSHSGFATGDVGRVVGYAAVLLGAS
ncbi:MAG TPA: AmmeMemoRadiSam system protein B [Gemmatimonadaceae bacterium]|nr:AmmeMemoRadiSam system protein B [Gemmatimonadaceae bacterium]